MEEPQSKLRGIWNLAMAGLGIFVIVTAFQLEPGISGKLDEDCNPKYPAFFVSWAAPSYFWSKQADYFSKRALEPFEPPSVQTRKALASIDAGGARELLKALQASQPPKDPAVLRVEALRAEADRIEDEHSMRKMDEMFFEAHKSGTAYAQRCLLRARKEMVISG